MLQTDWTSALANHLWESTAFVAVAWLLAFAMRKNQARTRYWIWLIASLKFLVPFSLFTEAGARIGSVIASLVTGPVLSQTGGRLDEFAQMARITQPFQQAPFLSGAASVANHATSIALTLLAVWILGVSLAALSWIHKWRQIRATLSSASPLAFTVEVPAGIPILCSSSRVEPGVFGIFHPVLLLPAGIANRLSESQMQAIVAHEISHVQRRDNLTFAIHMVVETIFWFHPLVWLIRARLIEERERACDEAVLQSGNEAEVYAEGILNVCKFYVESPLACAAGVTGSDLKQRIVRIMSQALGENLSLTRKLLLSAIAALAVATPIIFGLAHTTQIFAQTKVADDASASLPEFDVATIKPNKGGGDRIQFLFSTNGLSLVNIPIQMMLQNAFDVQDDRILGAPDWAKSDRFDVEAKVSGADAAKLDSLTIDQRRLMLLPLLANRFNLKYHHETKELPVYILTIAKGGPKLKEAAPQGSEKRSGIRMSGLGDFEGIHAGMDVLAHVLARQPDIGHTIIDKTGLTGSYDFHLQWAPGNSAPVGPGADGHGTAGAPPADDNRASLFTALQEELGLKLEAQKGPVDVIVIDHIDQPSPN